MITPIPATPTISPAPTNCCISVKKPEFCERPVDTTPCTVCASAPLAMNVDRIRRTAASASVAPTKKRDGTARSRNTVVSASWPTYAPLSRKSFSAIAATVNACDRPVTGSNIVIRSPIFAAFSVGPPGTCRNQSSTIARCGFSATARQTAASDAYAALRSRSVGDAAATSGPTPVTGHRVRLRVGLVNSAAAYPSGATRRTPGTCARSAAFTGLLGFDSSTTPNPPERLFVIASARPWNMYDISPMYTRVRMMMANIASVMPVRNRRASG